MHSGHTSSFREYIAGSPAKRDPRLISEAAVGTDGAAVASQLDDALRADQNQVCAAANDPLAEIFNKPLWVWSNLDNQWVDDTPFTVGGGAATHSCGDEVSEG